MAQPIDAAFSAREEPTPPMPRRSTSASGAEPPVRSGVSVPSHGNPDADQARALTLIARASALLYANGQTSERVGLAVARLGCALGFKTRAAIRWDEIVLCGEAGGDAVTLPVAVSPLGLHMGKVAAAETLVDAIGSGSVTLAQAEDSLTAIAGMPPAPTARFAVMAGLGAAALGVIFGVAHLVSLALIAASAGGGGLLRRALMRFSQNPYLPPFSAALCAGLIGAVAERLHVSGPGRLVALCPCMVLVPGPHFLNGAIDLVRAKVPLGAARLVYATLIVAAICAGLLGGLAIGGVSLSVGPSVPVAFAADVAAAGVAVAAYGTFFSMPWRTLPVPVGIGMCAHALRWVLLTSGQASAAAGAFAACLLAGTLAALAAERLRLPFAALAFASVVSLIPGVFLFRMAGSLVALTSPGAVASPTVAGTAVADGATALLILLAMTAGLIVPRLAIERLARRAEQ